MKQIEKGEREMGLNEKKFLSNLIFLCSSCYFDDIKRDSLITALWRNVTEIGDISYQLTRAFLDQHALLSMSCCVETTNRQERIDA